MIATLTGMKIDEKASSLAKTGGSTTGNVGRNFFTKKFLSTILQLVPESHKADVTLLHRNLSAIFRIMSCTRKIDVPEYEQLIEQTCMHIAT